MLQPSAASGELLADAPHHDVRPVLRGCDLTVAHTDAEDGYGTSPTKPKPLPPRPAQPAAQPTRKPLARDLNAWWTAAEAAIGGAA